MVALVSWRPWSRLERRILRERCIALTLVAWRRREISCELLGSARGEVLAPELVDVAVADPSQAPGRFAVTRRCIVFVVTLLVGHDPPVTEVRGSEPRELPHQNESKIRS